MAAHKMDAGPFSDLQSDGFIFWSQPIWVMMEPVFQMRWSMPWALKKA
jgi:hypothetical protein